MGGGSLMSINISKFQSLGDSLIAGGYMDKCNNKQAFEDQSSSAIPNQMTALKKRQSLKILIVEDNFLTRCAIKEMLATLGYCADFVEDGLAALSSYCANYHLILMDIDIPCLNGLEVTQIIRAIEKNHNFQNVPIVAITSHFDEPEYKEKCLSVGMNGLSGKPTAKQLEALILKHAKNYITH